MVDVTPSQVNRLQSILDVARPGDTIQLSDGLYPLPQTLVFRTPGVTLRSKSGNRLGVVLDGRYAIGDVLLLQRSDITIADLTLTRSHWHLVHVVPNGGSSSGTTLHNLRAVDGGEQFIKVNPAGGQYADNGVVRCSSLEMTDVGRTYVRNNCYTGGIDIHQARGWQIYANALQRILVRQRPVGARDPCLDRQPRHDRRSQRHRQFRSRHWSWPWLIHGGQDLRGFAVWRSPEHRPLRRRDHQQLRRGERRSVSLQASAGFDTGIGLEQSCETTVVHNTVVSTTAPRSSSIEWRFANTTAIVANNLVTHVLLPRDGARAGLAGNVDNAPLSLFVDVASANLHLLPGATAAIGKARCSLSRCLRTSTPNRRDAAPDVGADEYVAPVLNEGVSLSRVDDAETRLRVPSRTNTCRLNGALKVPLV